MPNPFALWHRRSPNFTAPKPVHLAALPLYFLQKQCPPTLDEILKICKFTKITYKLCYFMHRTSSKLVQPNLSKMSIKLCKFMQISCKFGKLCYIICTKSLSNLCLDKNIFDISTSKKITFDYVAKRGVPECRQAPITCTDRQKDSRSHTNTNKIGEHWT